MARRRAPQRPAGGGGGIQAIRKARARLTLAALSALAYAAVLAYAAARAPALAGIVLGVGVFGAALHVLVLWRGIEELLPWSLIVLAIGYTISLLVHGGRVDGASPLVAVALLSSAELAVWSLEQRQPVPAERRILASRVWALSALAVGGLLASGLVVALSNSTAGTGLAWTALGTLAAVLVVAIATRLVRRTA